MPPRAGSRKNPETGKFEQPNESGQYSWEGFAPEAEAREPEGVSMADTENSSSNDSFSMDTPTGFTQRPLTEATDKQPRISLLLTQDGKIDLDRTSEKNKSKLRSALADSEAKKQLGLLARQLFSEQQLAWVLSYMGRLEAIVVCSTSRGKVEQDIANQAFEYSQDELRQLAIPATKIANKHASRLTALSENFEEFQFCSMFAMITFAKYRLALQLQNERNLHRAQPNGGLHSQQNRAVV
jgi:hypothetical protein